MTSVHFSPGSQPSDTNGVVDKMENAKVEIDDGKDVQEEADTLYSMIRRKITPFVMSFGFRVFGVALILVDIVLVVVDMCLPYHSPARDAVEALSLTISLFFLMDVLLRVCVEGFKVYFSSKMNIVDACIVVVTLGVTMIYTFSDMSGSHLIP
ncbi:hypothetical protein CRUP_036095, partial [Coryphaenoides rupestris]